MSEALLPLLLGAAALGAVLPTSLPRRVVSLALLTVGIAVAYLRMGAPILAAVQVLLYAGGIVVLFGIAVGSTGGAGGERIRCGAPLWGGLVSAIGISLAAFAVRPVSEGAAVPADPSAGALMVDRTIAFEGIGLVVLVAVVGALALIRPQDAP